MLDGDAYNHYPKPSSAYGAVSVNGMFNDKNAAQQIAKDTENTLNEKTFPATNDTHFWGIGDIIQVLGETVGAITTPSVRMAETIRKTNAKTVIAHSQGTSVFRGTRPLLSNAEITKIDYQGFGGQVFHRQGNLNSVHNFANPRDFVPYLDPFNSIRRIGPVDMIPGSGLGHSWDEYKGSLVP